MVCNDNYVTGVITSSRAKKKVKLAVWSFLVDFVELFLPRQKCKTFSYWLSPRHLINPTLSNSCTMISRPSSRNYHLDLRNGGVKKKNKKKRCLPRINMKIYMIHWKDHRYALWFLATVTVKVRNRQKRHSNLLLEIPIWQQCILVVVLAQSWSQFRNAAGSLL